MALLQIKLIFHLIFRKENSIMYRLIDENGNSYESNVPGKFGGNKKLKIYGKLDCPSANRYIKKGLYVQNRVFFKDEKTAQRLGYRPCYYCMREEYNKWKNDISTKRETN